jgi:hypothetical protein
MNCYPNFALSNASYVQTLCLMMYPPPLIFLCPFFWFYFVDPTIYNTTGVIVLAVLFFNGVVILTKIFALVTDIMLLRFIGSSFGVKSSPSARKKKAYLTYAFLFLLLIADIVAKLIRVAVTKSIPLDGLVFTL